MQCLVPKCLASANQMGFCERGWQEVDEAERQAIFLVANGSASAAVARHIANRVAARCSQ